MPKFLADENVTPLLVRLLREAVPELDLVTVREAQLLAAPDPDLLEWAAQNDRVIITHDKKTMVPDAWTRVASGLAMQGVVFVPQQMPIGMASELLAVVATAGLDADFVGNVLYLSRG